MQEVIIKLIEVYKNGSDEPLDGDEVDLLVSSIRNSINLNEGNITQEEHTELEFKNIDIKLKRYTK